MTRESCGAAGREPRGREALLGAAGDFAVTAKCTAPLPANLDVAQSLGRPKVSGGPSAAKLPAEIWINRALPVTAGGPKPGTEIRERGREAPLN